MINAANALDNVMVGHNDPIDTMTFVSDSNEQNTVVPDVRRSAASKPLREKYGDRWINIPQSELKERIAQVPRDKSV